MKIELGSGFHPVEGFDIHMDINPECPHLEKIGSVDSVPFPDNTFEEARASDVLEHFSYRDTLRVLKEWFRILQPGGKIYIQCPNAKLLAQRWINNDLPLMDGMPIDFSASYWILGGHNDGCFAKNDDTWRFNAHYTLFSSESLEFYLRKVGFRDIDIQSDGGSNLICWARK